MLKYTQGKRAQKRKGHFKMFVFISDPCKTEAEICNPNIIFRFLYIITLLLLIWKALEWYNMGISFCGRDEADRADQREPGRHTSRIFQRGRPCRRGSPGLSHSLMPLWRQAFKNLSVPYPATRILKYPLTYWKALCSTWYLISPLHSYFYWLRAAVFDRDIEAVERCISGEDIS